MSELSKWFFFRPGFDNFKLDPLEHARFLIGDEDRARRDELLTRLDGAARAMNGQKAVYFGDYGRGKTHLCHNLEHAITMSKLSIVPIYVRCAEYKSKDEFSH